RCLGVPDAGSFPLSYQQCEKSFLNQSIERDVSANATKNTMANQSARASVTQTRCGVDLTSPDVIESKELVSRRRATAIRLHHHPAPFRLLGLSFISNKLDPKIASQRRN